MFSLSVLRRPVGLARGTSLTGGGGRMVPTGPTGREGSELVIVRIDVGPFDFELQTIYCKVL